MLGVGVRRLRPITATGQLKTYPGNQYRLEDVAVLADLRKRELDLPTVSAMAMQASLASKKLERLVSQLLLVVGADIPQLDLSPGAVRSMCIEANAALLEPAIYWSSQRVFEWARIFYAAGEEFFEAINLHVGLEDPWRPFVDLSKHILTQAPERLAGQDLEVRAAYQYLDMARRTMRQAAFFYVQGRHGKRKALKLFSESRQDVHEELAALAATIFKR